MSDAHNEHESLIKTPKQLIAVIAASFIIPIVCIVLLVHFVASEKTAGSGLSTEQIAQGTANRIRPVSDAGFTLIDANAPKQLQSGEAVYKAVCAACHDTGAAGAPKTGDAGGWSARLKQGYDSLVGNAIKGIRAMPAKGGNPDLDDVEVARAVVYMANQSGANFKEPAVKAAPAPAATADTGTAPAIAQGAQVASATAPLASSPTQQVQAVTADAGKVDTGKKVYEAACVACHSTGAAGAPKLGDKAAWAPRLKKGQDVLHANAIKGIGAMPPKGGASASDDDIKAAVNYMTASAK